MSRSRRAATALVLALGVVVVGLAPVVSADPGSAGTPLDDARLSAEVIPFVGTVSVQWSDRDGFHNTQLTVRGTGGEVQIDGAQPVIATLAGRFVLRARGWSLIAPNDPSTLGRVPPLSDKFALTTMVGPMVAGRPTRLFDVHTLHGDSDELLYLDMDTGIVLRRIQIDGGHAVRIVEFTTIQVGSLAQEATLPIHRDDLPQRLGPASLPAPFRAPVKLAAGYSLVGVLRQMGAVQVVYSDGLHDLSLFEQTGTLDFARLPGSGESVALPGGPGVRYSWPGGQLITWQSGQANYTVVGDGPAAELLAAANSVPPARRLSVLQRVRSTCRRLLGELAGRD